MYRYYTTSRSCISDSCSVENIRVFLEFPRIGYYISAIVANSFLTASLFFRTDPVAFLILTEICFVLTIADDFSTFSCPEGLVRLFLALSLPFFT